MPQFDVDLFYVYLSNAFIPFPSMRVFIDELYKTEIICDYGFEIGENPIWKKINKIIQPLISGLNPDAKDRKEYLAKEDIRKYALVVQEKRKIFDSFRSGKDILDYFHCVTNTYGGSTIVGDGLNNPEPALKEKCRLLQLFFEKAPNDFMQFAVYLYVFNLQLELNGFTVTELWSKEYEIGKEERDLVRQCIASFYGTYDKDSSVMCSASLLLPPLLFGQMVRWLKKAKDFYYLNNNEIQYSELGRLTGKNKVLQEE